MTDLRYTKTGRQTVAYKLYLEMKEYAKDVYKRELGDKPKNSFYNIGVPRFHWNETRNQLKNVNKILKSELEDVKLMIDLDVEDKNENEALLKQLNFVNEIVEVRSEILNSVYKVKEVETEEQPTDETELEQQATKNSNELDHIDDYYIYNQDQPTQAYKTIEELSEGVKTITEGVYFIGYNYTNDGMELSKDILKIENYEVEYTDCLEGLTSENKKLILERFKPVTETIKGIKKTFKTYSELIKELYNKKKELLKTVDRIGGKNMKQLHDNFNKEKKRLMRDSENFIYEMFMYELENMEYFFSRDVYSLLHELGITQNDIRENSKLQLELDRATKDYLKNFQEMWC